MPAPGSHAPGRPPGAPDPTVERDAYEALQCYTLSLGDSAFIHQHVVDAWTAQHASGGTKAIAVTFALVGLCLHVERGRSGREVQRVHMRLSRRGRVWPAFPLPVYRGAMTAVEVMAESPGQARAQAITRWCRSVWEAFGDSHRAVAELLQKHGVG